MSAVLVGLVALALAVVLQRLLLVGQARQLTARQQAYRFHAIRDELQSLAIMATKCDRSPSTVRSSSSFAVRIISSDWSTPIRRR